MKTQTRPTFIQRELAELKSFFVDGWCFGILWWLLSLAGLALVWAITQSADLLAYVVGAKWVGLANVGVWLVLAFAAFAGVYRFFVSRKASRSAANDENAA